MYLIKKEISNYEYSLQIQEGKVALESILLCKYIGGPRFSTPTVIASIEQSKEK